MMRVFRTTIMAGLAGALGCASASAADLDWSVYSTVGHTDNATLVDADPVSDTIGSVGGSIDLERKGSRVSGRLRGAGSYRNYFDDTYDNDFLGSGTGELRLGLIGDSLSWSFEDTFGQVLTDAFEPSTPENRENLNVFSTGPDLRLQVGSATEVVVTGRFSASSYEESGSIDNQQISGSVALVRRPSAAIAWSINAAVSHVEYDAPGDPGYDDLEVFARLTSTSAVQTLTADLGVDFLDSDTSSEQTPLVRITWTRQLTPSWSLDLGAITEYRNADDQFVTGVGSGPDLGGTQDVLLTAEPLRDDSATLGLTFERARTTLRIHANAGQETYPESDNLDRDRWLVGAEASRRLTERLRGTLLARHENRTFDTAVGEDKTTAFGALLDWRLGKNLFLGLEGRHEERSGSTAFAYDETIYAATIAYRTQVN
jgi:hypothetical protein